MRLKPIPARKLIRLLQAHGFAVVSQRGSHVKLKDAAGHIVVVPIGKEIKVGLLAAILKDAGIERKALRE